MIKAAADSLARREEFADVLVRVGLWLTGQRIPYAIFGSLAASAWTDQGASLDFDRPGARHPAERIPDIDLLVPRTSLPAVRAYARSMRHGSLPVSIDTFWSECWIDFRHDAEFSYLTHRRIRLPVRTCLFTPRTASLLGREITVLDPRTLLHLYGMTGVARRKDRPRIAALAGVLDSGAISSRLTDEQYQAIRSFTLARRRRYPVFFAAKYAWVVLLDAVPPATA